MHKKSSYLSVEWEEYTNVSMIINKIHLNSSLFCLPALFMSDITEDNVIQFASIFRGRNDIYAVRWEKDGNSGYTPAYEVDWNDYQKHKLLGGTFKDYTKKEPLPYDNIAIKKHLSGIETCGIFPLLDDNTSYFITADFDKANWQEAIRTVHQRCSELQLPSYLERSRSGNGGHLWIFFESAFP